MASLLGTFRLTIDASYTFRIPAAWLPAFPDRLAFVYPVGRGWRIGTPDMWRTFAADGRECSASSRRGRQLASARRLRIARDGTAVIPVGLRHIRRYRGPEAARLYGDGDVATLVDERYIRERTVKP